MRWLSCVTFAVFVALYLPTGVYLRRSRQEQFLGARDRESRASYGDYDVPVEPAVVATAFKLRRLSVVGYLSERRIRCLTGCCRECDGNFAFAFPEGFVGASVMAESLKQGGGVLCAGSFAPTVVT